MNSAVVVDIGGTTIKMGTVESSTPTGYTRVFPTRTIRSHDPIGELAAMIGIAMKETGTNPEVVVITVPGFLDATRRRVLHAANVPELDGRDVGRELQARLSLPVILERDSVLALRGEYRAGACGDARWLLGIFFGTGVGAALLEDGRPLRGSGWALEVGHMPSSNGHQWLPDRGNSLESAASGAALQAIASHHHVKIGDVFCIDVGSSQLREDIDQFLSQQAKAVACAVAILSPNVVVLGGGVCEMPGYPRARLAAEIQRNYPFDQAQQALDLRWASLGWKSVLHGASLAMQEGWG